MNTLKNKVNLIGRLGAKPELMEVKGGNHMVRLSLATNERYRDRSGQWRDNTQWHQAIAWGKNAESLVKLADKGTELAIEGKLVNRQYQTKSGEKRYSTAVEVSEFMLVGSKKMDESTVNED